MIATYPALTLGSMKAIRIESRGGPEVLQLRDVSAPQPGQGRIVVQQEAIGVNFVDVYRRTGLYPVDLPYIPGQEGSGTVKAIGPGVSDLRVGDRVAYATTPGTYAELVDVPADQAVRVPKDISFDIAAAVMLQGMTAHYLAVDTYPIRPGDTVLVHAGAGGVGGLLVQIARMRGARVIATVSSEEKAEVARACGAQETILYSRVDFEAEVRRLTGGKGVQAVYDSVGKDTLAKSLNCVAPRGILVTFGQSSGKVDPIDPLALSAKGSLYLTRTTLAHYVPDAESLRRRANELFSWISTGRLTVRIAKKLPLQEAAQAHRLLEGRSTIGKLLLDPH